MSVVNGDQALTDQWMQDTIDGTKREAARLSEQSKALAERQAEVGARLKKVATVLKQLSPEDHEALFPPSPQATGWKKRQAKGNTSYGSGLGSQNAKVLMRALLDADVQTFSALQLHHEILQDPWSEPHTYTLLKSMREAELIGKAGKDPETKRSLWRVLDRDAMTQRIGDGVAA